MDLILIRHGESTGNVARSRAVHAGAEIMDIPEADPDVPLTALGTDQAHRLGLRLAKLPKPDLVLSSPYLRALDTARIASGREDVRIDERLRDRDMGRLYRLTPIGVKARFPEELELMAETGKFYYRPPGGESWADMALRLRTLVAELPADARVLISSHDAVIVLLRYIVEGLSVPEILEIEKTPVGNCSMSRWIDGRAELYNDIAHLI
ncbi:histidine phosphatase family protein [Actinocorallia lasiicapitis]